MDIAIINLRFVDAFIVIITSVDAITIVAAGIIIIIIIIIIYILLLLLGKRFFRFEMRILLVAMAGSNQKLDGFEKDWKRKKII